MNCDRRQRAMMSPRRCDGWRSSTPASGCMKHLRTGQRQSAGTAGYWPISDGPLSWRQTEIALNGSLLAHGTDLNSPSPSKAYRHSRRLPCRSARTRDGPGSQKPSPSNDSPCIDCMGRQSRSARFLIATDSSPLETHGAIPEDGTRPSMGAISVMSP